ncbi:MAG TPA: hypothetical protein ENK02_00520 [Planctomycetes bacterium]|nr:hypothetical protein [Planctomycetota bacterium]
MATRRSNRTSSRPSGRGRPRGRAGGRPANKGGNKAAPALLAIVVLGGVVLAFALLGGKGKEGGAQNASSLPPSNKSNNHDLGSETSSRHRTDNQSRPGSGHKAPTLSREEELECDRLYEEAKKNWNDALKIKDSDRSQFVAKRKRALSLIEELMDKIGPILDWEEKATMNDWPIPYEVENLMRKYNKWTKLQATVHRMSSLKK